jgi:hypothetical protein
MPGKHVNDHSDFLKIKPPPKYKHLNYNTARLNSSPGFGRSAQKRARPGADPLPAWIIPLKRKTAALGGFGVLRRAAVVIAQENAAAVLFLVQGNRAPVTHNEGVSVEKVPDIHFQMPGQRVGILRCKHNPAARTAAFAAFQAFEIFKVHDGQFRIILQSI